MVFSKYHPVNIPFSKQSLRLFTRDSLPEYGSHCVFDLNFWNPFHATLESRFSSTPSDFNKHTPWTAHWTVTVMSHKLRVANQKIVNYRLWITIRKSPSVTHQTDNVHSMHQIPGPFWMHHIKMYHNLLIAISNTDFVFQLESNFLKQMGVCLKTLSFLSQQSFFSVSIKELAGCHLVNCYEFRVIAVVLL